MCISKQEITNNNALYSWSLEILFSYCTLSRLLYLKSPCLLSSLWTSLVSGFSLYAHGNCPFCALYFHSIDPLIDFPSLRFTYFPHLWFSCQVNLPTPKPRKKKKIMINSFCCENRPDSSLSPRCIPHLGWIQAFHYVTRFSIWNPIPPYFLAWISNSVQYVSLSPHI